MRTIITILSLAAIAAIAATAAKPACSVNVNRAPVDSLALCLPGVGKSTAARIDSARKAKPFQTCADLDAVKGFGVAKLAKVCPLVVF